MIETTRHKIRILVAERIHLIRLGIRYLFENHPVIGLVQETNTIDGLPELTARHQPDVILLGTDLINDQCAEHVSQLRKSCSHSKIVLFSHLHPEHLRFYTLPLGVSGIISKSSSSRLLVNAICAIYADRDCRVTLSDLLSQTLRSPEHRIAQPCLPSEITALILSDLNKNERRVAHLAGKGLSAREISQKLLLTEKTVRNYLSSVYKKMGVKKQIELCLRAPLHNYFQD